MREILVVRNMGSGRTHLADVEQRWIEDAIVFGAPYKRPPASTVSLCGVRIHDGVVMQGSRVPNCRPCAHIGGRS